MYIIIHLNFKYTLHTHLDQHVSVISEAAEVRYLIGKAARAGDHCNQLQ